MGTGSDSESEGNGWGRARGILVKAAVLIGGAILLKRLTKSTTRWDHARFVSHSLSGEKVPPPPTFLFFCRFSPVPSSSSSSYCYCGFSFLVLNGASFQIP